MMRARLALPIIALALSACATRPAGDDALAIAEDAGAYVLSVPASRLVLTLPKGDLVLQPRNPADTRNRRYFFLSGKTSRVIVSGWFEPDRLFPGIEKLGSGYKEASETNGPAPQESAALTRIGDWDVIAYDHSFPRGELSTHFRAHLVRAGTWIELHLSHTSHRNSEENRAALADFLRGVAIAETAR